MGHSGCFSESDGGTTRSFPFIIARTRMSKYFWILNSESGLFSDDYPSFITFVGGIVFAWTWKFFIFIDYCIFFCKGNRRAFLNWLDCIWARSGYRTNILFRSFFMANNPHFVYFLRSGGVVGSGTWAFFAEIFASDLFSDSG